MAGKIAKHAHAYGWPRALWNYARGKFGIGPYALIPPGIDRPVWVRPRSSDRNMFDNIFLEDEYDYPYETPPASILDCGANVGYTSVFLANRFPEARIVAVEPEDSNFALLVRNTAAYPQITPVKAGIWIREAHLEVENPDTVNSGFKLRETTEPGRGIAAKTIPQLLDAHGLAKVDVVKIDVEGTELELLRDPACDEWIKRARRLVIELHERFHPGCEAALDAVLARHPHRRFDQGENIIIDFQR